VKWPSIKRSSIPADERIPRGAIIVVAVGLLATLAAAVLTTGKGSGEAAHLEFTKTRKIADSKAVTVPGSNDAKMRLVEGNIRSTNTNTAGYSLFRVFYVLKIDKGAPIGGGRILCSIHVPRSGTEIAHSSGTGSLRMLYPRSSREGIYGQPIPEGVVAQFSSHGYELAVLEEISEDMPARWASIQGVKLGWPQFEEGTEHLLYYLPDGKAKETVLLPSYSLWKTQKPAKAQIACTLRVAAGKATVETEGSLTSVPPPIDEEAEELAQEEREEATEEGEGSEGE
jgi:hypothetical protein